MSRYTLSLDSVEVTRYARMVAAAVRSEEAAWEQAGIIPGARVVDLGCGPGAFLPELARRTGAGITAVDADDVAVQAARAFAAAHHLDGVEVYTADVADTGLRAASFDVAFMRHVLLHNGGRLNRVLDHVSALLRPGGALLSVEGDLTSVTVENGSPEEADLAAAWVALLRRRGNDPAIGVRLGELVEAAGYRVIRQEQRVDVIEVDRPPAWSAVDAMLADGVADGDDVAAWDAAIRRRLAERGPLRASVPMYLVVACPPM